MAKLTDFFLGAWNLFEILEMNFAAYGYPPEEVRAFVEASSKFYPDFGKLIGQRVEKWLRQQRSRWGVPFDVPEAAFDQVLKNLEALHQALGLAALIKSSETSVESLTAVSLQMQHLYEHKKKIMGRWSAIFKKLRHQIQTQKFYEASDIVSELIARSRQAQESSREIKVLQLPETAG